jgi:hypothetical protein
MPAKSEKQRRFMGMVHAYKSGKLKNASPEVKRAAASISDDAAVDFAKHVKESFAEFYRRDQQGDIE